MKKKIFYTQCVLILLIYIFGNNVVSKKVEYYNEMLKAKNNVEILFGEIKNKKQELGIPFDKKLDINNTGMIGEEYTGMTTTMGDLDSKRLSTNSNFAAYFVKLFKESNLKAGDLVLVNMSSSFPGINLSLISALDTLNLKGVLVNSIGSSMYGANNEKFTFLEMAKYLEDKKLIENKISAYSWGGDWDVGENFLPEVKSQIEERIKDYGIKKFYNKNLEDNLKERYEYYNSFGEPKMFINVGGNLLFEKLIKEYEIRGIKSISVLNLKFYGSKLGLSIKQRKNVENVKLYYKSRGNISEIMVIIIFILGMLTLWKIKSK
ncbi:poly-gamma-glutamate system protein [Fusobacterium sp. MFO224]|uniref:poly-gamma-glutamate system protein n=1 Tax=Fusobacterium sp. MFO224 TaxID=3378070 RepID=UPI003851C180